MKVRNSYDCRAVVAPVRRFPEFGANFDSEANDQNDDDEDDDPFSPTGSPRSDRSVSSELMAFRFDGELFGQLVGDARQGGRLAGTSGRGLRFASFKTVNHRRH